MRNHEKNEAPEEAAADVLFGRQVPQYVKFCSFHNFFFVYRSLCPLLLMVLFLVDWLQ